MGLALQVATELLVVLILCIPGYMRYVMRGSHAAETEAIEKSKPTATPLAAADPEAPPPASPAAESSAAARESTP